MSTIPIQILGRVVTRSRGRRAACKKRIEFVGSAPGSTAGFEFLVEAILIGIFEHMIEGIPVVCIYNDGLWKLYPEIIQFRLEDCVVSVDFVVHTGHTPHFVSIV